MSRLLVQVKRSTLPVLIVLCLAALTVSYAYAEGSLRPLATQVIGDPDAAVTGKLAVGTATPGNKALTVVGVIDFLGAGTTHNYFTQGGGNNMQINANVDEANTVGDASRSQWKMVMGSSLDQFSIRRSPAGGTYNEDALFFINSNGTVGIGTFDTGNGATIPFTPQARLHAQSSDDYVIWGENTGHSPAGRGRGVTGTTTSAVGEGVYGYAAVTTGDAHGVYGLTESNAGFGVYGNATATSGSTRGVFGQSASPTGVGVSGYAYATTGQTYGVFGQSASTNGTGVHGLASATDGVNYGVWGQSESPYGTGVWGVASATTGAANGVYGRTRAPDGSGVFGIAWVGGGYGVYGQSQSSDGRGVFGMASATYGNNYGVYGRSESPEGDGVVGRAAATTGEANGVYGLTSSSEGQGVKGVAEATTGTTYGVYGRNDSGDGAGVYGKGVWTGVLGDTVDDLGWAGDFHGNVRVQGMLVKAGGLFRIDHPLDPANKYLNHSFVESPDMKNIYDGVVTLDENGEGCVKLPDWFEALNQDFRYQLTPIGRFAPLYISSEMGDNSFQIAGGFPGMVVSWQVTGIRHDLYAEAHRIPVEEDKPLEGRGTYLFPELYGQPAELATSQLIWP